MDEQTSIPHTSAATTTSPTPVKEQVPLEVRIARKFLLFVATLLFALFMYAMYHFVVGNVEFVQQALAESSLPPKGSTIRAKVSVAGDVVLFVGLLIWSMATVQQYDEESESQNKSNEKHWI